ncbi:formimidoylglutamate deiminase [Brucella melitensis]|uniref:Atrazine chlorohydrolase n=1 Tax=Brucella melitensis biotype 1 (strain ATCC 23456 / CCUG 17765 / NCTC 10094 / 16M) TaxID=224914 RepID=Q8YD08_BRUME|nr:MULTISPECIES: formimidoylglutamate deiminase [Brucella]AAL53611.1 atrazine chlorohydrolase [Brucella melitensis bv. 1 str. 16M]AIJ88547.1 formiminoglutamate deiminase [Brucella melitensis bv. 1 str. 16M]ARY45485.1 formimidoylglutamate deiminase [Brucella melitensis]ARY48648.1 formimidoylglutamate deiminase [Brucella melitensis]AVM32609.1 formimidoylglutamate deiminase [Brucella melitensis]
MSDQSSQHFIHARQALLPDGWAENVRIGIAGGVICSIETGVLAGPDDERQSVVVAGMANLHSHAFQYGMAGLAERRGPSADSFWSWREIMYKFALTMTPEQAEAVALRLYVDMLEAGFTRVGEFHYLHHDCDGTPYANLSEMADRITAAATTAGMGLTLLPVFYAHSGFGGAAANEGQRRFINDPERFARLIEGCRKTLEGFEGAVLGVAPHSLRAVTPDELDSVTQLLPDAPVHIHVAEQVKEVEDCIAWSGKRPVEWLLDHQDVTARWCLIHATHMSDEETKHMAKAGAIAGLCPVTEANLGDGTFNATEFAAAGGKFGIGSDSNVLIGIGDELRQLEYSQRLYHRARNVLAANEKSTGRALFDGAVLGGNIAMGRPEDGLKKGASADFVSLDVERLPHAKGDVVLDGWIFAGRAHVCDVWVRGVKQVEGGRHRLRDEAERAFQKALGELLA